MRRRKPENYRFLYLWAALSAAGCNSLPVEESTAEKNYTLYVDLGVDAPNQMDNVADGDIAAQSTMTPTPTPEAVPSETPKPTAAPTKAVEKAKPRSTADDEVSADEAQRLFDQARGTMQQRGILADDINNGSARLQTIRKYLDGRDYKLAENLIRSFVNDLNAVRIDEVFITKKNARLLGLIQEKNPGPEVQAKIDGASEEINQLLDQANFQEINRRLNGLFELIGP